jgi:hypothetical protein
MMTTNYRPSQKIPKSGIYGVVHTNNHAVRHEVTLIGGRDFPPCNDCGEHVYFTLVMAAQYINNNPHFHKATTPPAVVQEESKGEPPSTR